ncbi:hypothetical protein [Oceanirhabdus sp. W0125-5]|uniref:hypothetical protein n=1 Tax=Oceanirhabdus sp. W0125-5 TaxID=2999116 RepID=UPI0022F2E555|nr:hypothetical protein [Oceanirhabdus sp. W0125-5]WBW96447.1 hypothetical protein OW730_22545 [Oceanirhabdus sp. W0125-5]
MKKTNKYITTGLLIYAITLLLKHLIGLPEFIYGLGLGISIALELIGAYSINHDISKFKNFKMNFYKRCFNK